MLCGWVLSNNPLSGLSGSTSYNWPHIKWARRKPNRTVHDVRSGAATAPILCEASYITAKSSQGVKQNVQKYCEGYCAKHFVLLSKAAELLKKKTHNFNHCR